MDPITREQALTLGGKPWTGKGGTERIYLNADVWGPLIGLKIEHHKSGNIRDAVVGDRQLSNRQGAELASAKVWIDTEGAVHVDNISDWRMQDIAEQIAAAVRAAAGQEEAQS